jgi:hypothetical protein
LAGFIAASEGRGFPVRTRQSNRDTLAELNRRSQACEVLTGTGVRVAKMACRAEAAAKAGRASGTTNREAIIYHLGI